jgi:hypothetical protein
VERYRVPIIVLTAVAIVWSMMIAGFLGIFVVAMLGAVLTVGLRTGSLAHYYPTISRTGAPWKFWLVMFGCAVVIAWNVLNLFLRS